MSTRFHEAIETFNRGEYFVAAEAFEHAMAQGELRELSGALNRIATAFHMRFERGGRQAAVNLLSQAMIALEPLKPVCDGIDVERLFGEIAAFTETLRAAPKGERSGLKHRARLFLERRSAPQIQRI